MKILITGITGLIGNYTMEVLLQNEYKDLRGQYFSKRDVNEYKTRGIEMVQADICNEGDLKDITKDCEVVVHSAAKVIDFGSKKDFYTAHYDATFFLLKDAL